jgi:hypothetical protein
MLWERRKYISAGAAGIQWRQRGYFYAWTLPRIFNNFLQALSSSRFKKNQPQTLHFPYHLICLTKIFAVKTLASQNKQEYLRTYVKEYKYDAVMDQPDRKLFPPTPSPTAQ